MAKKKITLTEEQFRDKVKSAVRESVKRILKEGFADRELDEKWIDAERQMGSENMLMEVYNYFDADQLEDFLRSIDGDWDLGLFEDEYSDDEEEEEEEEIDADENLNWQPYNG